MTVSSARMANTVQRVAGAHLSPSRRYQHRGARRLRACTTGGGDGGGHGRGHAAPLCHSSRQPHHHGRERQRSGVYYAVVHCHRQGGRTAGLQCYTGERWSAGVPSPGTLQGT